MNSAVKTDDVEWINVYWINEIQQLRRQMNYLICAVEAIAEGHTGDVNAEEYAKHVLAKYR